MRVSVVVHQFYEHQKNVLIYCVPVYVRNAIPMYLLQVKFLFITDTYIESDYTGNFII